MKNTFTILVALTIFATASAQTNTFPTTGAAGIGTTTPDASSLLDVTSTAKGVLVPRMTLAQRNAIASPAKGLLIFQTNSTPGFYYYSGAAWTAVAPKSANASLSNLVSPTAVNINLLPSMDSNTNLGSTSLRWKNIYLAGKLFIGGSAFLDGSGTQNTLIGNTGNTANTGSGNTAIGTYALSSNTTGSSNTANGGSALYANTTGYFNSANGAGALYNNNSGHDNTADGLFALLLNTSGFENTADGDNAGSNVTTGSNNTFIGALANSGSLGTLTNSTAIGYNSFVNASNNFVFGSSDVVGWGFGVEAGSRAIKVGTSPSNGNGAYLTVGGTWTNTSARNKKEDFQKQSRDSILEKINQLEVTKWKYKGTADEYHYGPMADDFHRLFEVGDDSSTSDMDKTGVLFLGMQALSDELKIENGELKMENEAQQKQIDELKSKVEQIQSSIDNQKSSMSNGYAKLQISNLEPQTLLGQNIPNPFDNSTLIPFRIPKDCKDASIMIANTSTSEMISVIPISCNEDHVSIDAGTLAGGSYSYTLYVDGKLIDTKQMVLLK